MIKVLLIITALIFTSCANKRGLSAKYYSDCKEYYDLQGFYHKDCNDEVVTYKEMKDKIKETSSKVVDKFTGKKPQEKKPTPNVW